MEINKNRPRSRNRPQAAAPSVRAVQRALDILDVVRTAPESVSLTWIAEATGLPVSSAFRYLATLEDHAYVERDATTHEYRLGRAFLATRYGLADVLANRARDTLEKLRDRLGETINLGILDGSRVVYLDIVESPHAMRLAARRGDRDRIHSTALGKALAAGLNDSEVRRILELEGMPALTGQTIRDADAFLRALDEVRARGFAVDDGENEVGARCVAVPVPARGLHAALSVSAPAIRLAVEGVEKAAASLTNVAKRLAIDFDAFIDQSRL